MKILVIMDQPDDSFERAEQIAENLSEFNTTARLTNQPVQIWAPYEG